MSSDEAVLSTARRWTVDHPGGGRADVDGNVWFAGDPYPTWYRYHERELVRERRPDFPEEVTVPSDELAELNATLAKVTEIYRSMADIADHGAFIDRDAYEYTEALRVALGEQTEDKI